MINLARPQTALLQAQIGEGLATVASYDFPDEWNNLVDVSFASACQAEADEVGSGQESDAR